jgi:hypothetical protein
MIQVLISQQTCLAASDPVLRIAPLLGFIILGVVFLIALSLFFALRRFRGRHDRILAGRRERLKPHDLDPWTESGRRFPLESDGPIESQPDDDLPDFGERS